MQIEANRYRIVPIGSASPQGWAIECDGKLSRSGDRLEVLGAWLDAILAGASEYDADDIAEVIRRRPLPSYEERLAVFKPSGRPEPSRDPFDRFEGRRATDVLTTCRPASSSITLWPPPTRTRPSASSTAASASAFSWPMPIRAATLAIEA
jgi:hypothetical protein